MNRYMKVPMKVAVGTSRLMIGVTAAVSSILGMDFTALMAYLAYGMLAFICRCWNVYEDVYRVLLAGTLISSALFALARPCCIRRLPLAPELVRSHCRWMAIWQGLKEFNALTLLLVATALLILTPGLRVVISIWAFWVHRDHKYVVVTSIVLGVIALSVVLAHFGVK